MSACRLSDSRLDDVDSRLDGPPLPTLIGSKVPSSAPCYFPFALFSFGWLTVVAWPPRRRPGLVAELPPKLARAPAGRGDFGPRMGGTLSTHSTLGTWVLESRSDPFKIFFRKPQQ